MKKAITKLGRTEWALMRICWKKGRSSARTIHEESLKNYKRTYNTVKTILDRLVKKHYLKREKFGPIWLYSPVMNEKNTLSKAINDFTRTVLDGSILPFFMNVLKKKKHRAELKEVKNMLDSLFNEENQSPAGPTEQE